jgi:hypothetical protein
MRCFRNRSTGIDVERDFRGFCVEREKESSSLGLDRCFFFRAIPFYFGELDIKPTLPGFSRPVYDFQHPNVGSTAWEWICAISTQSIQWQSTFIFHVSKGPEGVHLPIETFDDESLAAIVRITGGNFRLLHRLLSQIGRILEINELASVTPPVVDAARESLVIGTV